MTEMRKYPAVNGASECGVAKMSASEGTVTTTEPLLLDRDDLVDVRRIL